MNERNEAGIDIICIKVEYRDDLKEALSSSDLEQEVQSVWQKERSATTVLKTISSWEGAGICTIEDLCVILGWLLLDDKDPDWKKVWKYFSLEQQAQIKIPKWVKTGGTSPLYGDKYSIPSGGACGDNGDTRGW